MDERRNDKSMLLLLSPSSNDGEIKMFKVDSSSSSNGEVGGVVELLSGKIIAWPLWGKFWNDSGCHTVLLLLLLLLC